MKSNSVKNTSIYDLNGKPPFRQAFPLGLQQLLAMFVGNIVPMLLVSSIAGLSAADTTLLLQSSILGAGVATMIQAFPIKVGKFQAGSKLPVMMGLTYTFLPICISVSVQYGLAVLFGAQLLGAIVSIFIGMAIPKIRKYFPPIVTGTIIVSIGVSCFPIAIYNFAGGMGTPDIGAAYHWIIGTIVIITILGCSGFGKGLISAAAILIGMLVGYVVAIIWGIVDFSQVAEASWFALPRPLAFGLEFRWNFAIIFILLFFINAVEMTGDFTVSATGGLGRQPTNKELRGGIIGNGISCIFASFFNCFATGTYSQCSGIVALTKVSSRYVMGTAAGTLIIAAFSPKLAALLSVIPNSVIGGATVVVFSMIALSGMSLVAKSRFTNRSMLICGTSLALGLGLTFAKDTLAGSGEYIQMFFGESSIILVAGSALLLNLILPKNEIDKEVDEELNKALAEIPEE